MKSLSRDQRISGCLLVRNEEGQIRDAVQDMLQVCDEVVVTDHGSTDSTLDILEDLGVKVVHCPKEYPFTKARNFSLKQGRYQWKFFIDADERLGLRLIEELRALVKKKGCVYKLHRIDDIIPNAAGTIGLSGIVRIFRLEDFSYDEETGVMQSPLYSRNVKAIETDFTIIHCQRKNNMMFDATQVLKRVPMDIEFVERDGSFVKYFIRANIAFIRQFYYRYITRGGYKDGKAGLKWSFLRALFHFLRQLFVGMKVSDDEINKLVSYERTECLINEN